MRRYEAEKIDVAVIGAGHAGLEAALASARMGVKTALFTLTLDLVGNMPCNPSIGGTGKGHLVFEIDALGGEMGKAANEVMLQSRMLNASKGPAVRSLRMQSDRVRYRDYMKKTVEQTENLVLKQSEVVSVEADENGVCGVTTSFGAFYPCKCVVIATGTSLGGRIIVGEEAYESGPDNTLPAKRLVESLQSIGVKLTRFKTGTPPRVHADSIDYSRLERQDGDDEPVMFGFYESRPNLLPCYIAYTNQKTHDIIRANLDRSPLYSGVIHGTGPRYCPSIEDKVVRFSDKERHQIFVEPMGTDTKEVYLQGLSSSLPEEVQLELIHSIEGLENAEFMRTAYAIEYDCCDPLQLTNSLEFREISGLFGAGQFNGSSGYEEAAAQGLIAGINAALKVKGEGAFTLTRSESYIGTLIDDLVTKGTNEPYRIMTSRSEYRLLLRQDNAQTRLLPKGHELGLVSEARYKQFLKTEQELADLIYSLEHESIKGGNALDDLLEKRGYARTGAGIVKAELLKRPEITVEDILSVSCDTREYDKNILSRAETEIKYSGYIKRQLAEVERFSKLEEKMLPPDIDYTKIRGLRIEAAQKLQKLRPESIGRASRISGVSPSDVSVLLIYLSQGGKQ